MFGLEDQKKKKPTDEFIFELEKEFKDPAKNKEIRLLLETRLQKIKEILRSGANQDGIDRLGVLLHGYTALLKVMSRSTTKKMK